MRKQRKKLLIVGGISYKQTDKPRLGGTTVLMDNFVEYCQTHNVPHVLVTNNKYQGRLKGFRNFIHMMYGILRHALSCSVIMMNISSKVGFLLWLPMEVFVAKLFGIQAVCRMFAGSIHKYIEAKRWAKPFLLWCLKKTKVSFFETKELITYFKNNGYEAQWFTNVRQSSGVHRQEGKPYNKKFVFLSRVDPIKGVDQLKQCFETLPDDYHVDIYGPIHNYDITELNGKNYSYKSPLEPSKVASTLSQYDILLLPSMHKDEGYPGIIIESYDVGLPVIVSRIGGIPEIVKDGQTGILVEPGNVTALRQAILSITQENYPTYTHNARQEFALFDSDQVNAHVLRAIME